MVWSGLQLMVTWRTSRSGLHGPGVGVLVRVLVGTRVFVPGRTVRVEVPGPLVGVSVGVSVGVVLPTGKQGAATPDLPSRKPHVSPLVSNTTITSCPVASGGRG